MREKESKRESLSEVERARDRDREIEIDRWMDGWIDR
jgi:hypothetical protein